MPIQIGSGMAPSVAHLKRVRAPKQGTPEVENPKAIFTMLVLTNTIKIKILIGFGILAYILDHLSPMLCNLSLYAIHLQNGLSNLNFTLSASASILTS